jgi:hypothetical protein
MLPARARRFWGSVFKLPRSSSDNEKRPYWRVVMKRYYIKCRSGRIEYLDIIRENEAGFIIRLTRLSDGNEKIIEDFMSRHLFDTCLKTGYIYEAVNEAASVA